MCLTYRLFDRCGDEPGFEIGGEVDMILWKLLLKKLLLLKQLLLRKLQKELRLLLLNNTHSKQHNRSTFKTLLQCQI